MSGVADPDNLQRFVDAQAAVYDGVRRELIAGRKTGHWIWFIFPQLRGLGRSATAEKFGIASLAQARAYLAHPVLGPRLRESTRLLEAAADRNRPGGREAANIEAIVGWPDCLKVRSCMTLFRAASASGDDEAVFQAVLDKYYDGEPDEATLGLITRA